MINTSTLKSILAQNFLAISICTYGLNKVNVDNFSRNYNHWRHNHWRLLPLNKLNKRSLHTNYARYVHCAGCAIVS